MYSNNTTNNNNTCVYTYHIYIYIYIHVCIYIYREREIYIQCYHYYYHYLSRHLYDYIAVLFHRVRHIVSEKPVEDMLSSSMIVSHDEAPALLTSQALVVIVSTKAVAVWTLGLKGPDSEAGCRCLDLLNDSVAVLPPVPLGEASVGEAGSCNGR